MSNKETVYLASESPRRLQLLAQIGIKATVIPSKIVETKLPSESPLAYANRMAISKAQSGWCNSARIFTLPVIGADTIVVCDDKILGKPNNKKEGIAMLTTLSGRVHQVITAVAIVYATQVRQCYVESEVTFATLTESEIETYWDTGEPCDKAGAYAIQGRAAAFITYLTGSYSGVVGLPLFETVNLLREFGMIVLA